jgi:cyclopropane-fatty-acyl-phospholipid synthase
MLTSLQQKAQEILSLADVQINGNRYWDIKVHDEKFYTKVFSEGSLGLGEAYMDGLFDCEELDQFFDKILRVRLDEKVVPSSLFLSFIQAKIFNKQNRAKSKEVAHKHYNLGNDLYLKMLDKRMLYTCAYWKNASSLDEAQEHKLELICKKIRLKKNDKVLDLGCGWGSFAKYAAEKYGCHVTAVNIAEEQLKYGRESCKGLPVDFIKSDYRDVRGHFDKVVAIGLCEHVGPKNYGSLMKVAHDSLDNEGLFLLHTIGWHRSGIIGEPWLDKYIFPNSVLPSIKQLSEAAEGYFIIEDLHNFGADYDKTLMAWFEKFDHNWPTLKKDYDERFYRMWKYYLLMCAGTFRARYNQLWQLVLSKGGVRGGYESVR